MREEVLINVGPSWWHFAQDLLIGVTLVLAGLTVFGHGVSTIGGDLLMDAGLVVLALAFFSRKRTAWTVTSERLIARAPLFFMPQRQIALAEIGSIDAARSPLKQFFGLGTVTVVSSSSTHLQILLDDIRNPEEVAKIMREARLACRRLSSSAP